MRVPFLDLKAQDAAIGAAIREALAEVVASQQFILGPHVARFEAAMAAYCGVGHAIGVASGTDALALALGALGAGPGRAVVTTPFSFFATASTIVRVGARPLFADVDPDTLNIDPAAAGAVADTAGQSVVGIMPVHLFGRLAPMAALRDVAARRGLWMVEDAAQAVGARDGGVAAGAFAAAGCLSFYPTKNLVVTATAAWCSRTTTPSPPWCGASAIRGSGRRTCTSPSASLRVWTRCRRRRSA